MERDSVITEFRILDELGNDIKLTRETTIESMENGTDICFLYEEFIRFLKAAGFADGIIAKIQYIDK